MCFSIHTVYLCAFNVFTSACCFYFYTALICIFILCCCSVLVLLSLLKCCYAFAVHRYYLSYFYCLDCFNVSEAQCARPSGRDTALYKCSFIIIIIRPHGQLTSLKRWFKVIKLYTTKCPARITATTMFGSLSVH